MQIFNQTFKVKALYMKSTQTWNTYGVDDCSTILDMLEAWDILVIWFLQCFSARLRETSGNKTHPTGHKTGTIENYEVSFTISFDPALLYYADGKQDLWAGHM